MKYNSQLDYEIKRDARLKDMALTAICSRLGSMNFSDIDIRDLGQDKGPVVIIRKKDLVINTSDPLLKSLIEQLKAILPDIEPIDELMEEANGQICRMKTPSRPYDGGMPLEVWASSYEHSTKLDKFEDDYHSLNRERYTIISNYVRYNSTVRTIINCIRNYKEA